MAILPKKVLLLSAFLPALLAFAMAIGPQDVEASTSCTLNNPDVTYSAGASVSFNIVISKGTNTTPGWTIVIVDSSGKESQLSGFSVTGPGSQFPSNDFKQTITKTLPSSLPNGTFAVKIHDGFTPPKNSADCGQMKLASSLSPGSSPGSPSCSINKDTVQVGENLDIQYDNWQGGAIYKVLIGSKEVDSASFPITNLGSAKPAISVKQTSTTSGPQDVVLKQVDPPAEARCGSVTVNAASSGGLAYNNPCPIVNGSSSCETALGRIEATPEGFIKAVLALGIGLGGAIAIIMLVYGGFKIATSQGNPEAVQGGQQIITSAIAGLIFILASVFLLGLIAGNILGIPQFGGKAPGTGTGGGGTPRQQNPLTPGGGGGIHPIQN